MTNRELARSDEVSRRSILLGATTTAAVATTAAQSREAEAQMSDHPLPSWNDGPAKEAILRFVQATTALAPQHPEWRSREPFSAVLASDQAALGRLGEGDWAEIIFQTHTGMSQAAFRDIAGHWLATAKHPRFHRLYTELVYQPMIEVLHYLRAQAFKTYIVSGLGQFFMRIYTQRVYGIPSEQVLGSSVVTKYQIENGTPELMREPQLFLYSNFGGKPVAIDLFIGKRPYAAFGNSTGDRQMLEWTGAGNGARLRILVHHDDATREYAYGPVGGLPDTTVGTFDQSLMDEAKARDWTVISMKKRLAAHLCVRLTLVKHNPAIVKFPPQGVLDQVELNPRGGGRSRERNHLTPRFEHTIQTTDEGYHYADFGFTVDYHDATDKQQHKYRH